MKALLISPLRLADPSAWPRLTRHISGIFNEASLPEGCDDEWIFNIGTTHRYQSVDGGSTRAGKAYSPLIFEGLLEAFSQMRRNGFALRKLGDTSVVVLFDTADAAYIRLVDIEGDHESATALIVDERESELRRVYAAGEALEPFMSGASVSFEADETITHVLLFGDQDGGTFAEVARTVFRSEGLSYDEERSATPSSFTPGWSYSVSVTDNLEQFWTSAAVMIRAQCEWYTTRTARVYCLRILSETDLGESVTKHIKQERDIVSYQTELRMWRHRMQEFRANLKPSATESAQQVATKWDMEENVRYVHDTLSQARDFIQTSYTGRLLLQERRQSLMLSIITALGILSMASVAAVAWDWLTLANISEDQDVATPLGRALVIGGLSFVSLTFAIFLGYFLAIRFLK